MRPARPSAFTGRGGRRAVLQGLAAAPLLALLPPGWARAADYANAADVFAAIDAGEGEVAQRLRALSQALASARPFATSVLRDHERHRATRARLRARLGLTAGVSGGAPAKDLLSLGALRGAQEALVHVHAEGLPAVEDALVVDALARNLVDLARHLAVIDLWIEAEESRG